LGWQGREKIPCLDLHHIPHFTTGLDHPHAVQVGPRALRAKSDSILDVIPIPAFQGDHDPHRRFSW
jgi:hypothetical protein